MALLETLVPTLVNGVMQLGQNASNIRNYRDAQESANQFAMRMQDKANQYNSLPNQYAQMALVGMNPNLLTGQAFEASSPVPNQSVSPPQGIAPQMPVDSLAESNVKREQARLLNEQSLTEDALRGPRVKLANSEYEVNSSNVKLNGKQVEFLSKQMFSIDETVNEIRERIKSYQSQRHLTNEQWAAQKFQNEQNRIWLPRLNRAQFQDILASIGVKGAQSKMFLSQADNFSSMAVGQRLNNTFLRRTMDDRVNSLHFNTGIDRLNYKFAKETYQPRVDLVTYSRDGEKLRLSILQTQDDLLKFNFGQVKKYDDWRQLLNLGNQGVQFIQGIQNANPINQQFDRGLNTFGTLMGNSPSVTNQTGNVYDNGGFFKQSRSGSMFWNQ